ncbi:SAP domain-containing protein [Micromonospora sp. KC213]|uniref:SAP domain-containing protein n=1 Tax=Micromonospora sp. KC213 TaxID=2530378 RepID=UPI0010485DF3|nr:SAP domain-containing protein [Micromonospora sp. KC213]TDC43071.1 hypothetical protein E1166_05145 [Micromonospora sp. KC213]
MTEPAPTAALLVRLAELVRDLPPAELAALAEGRARLAVVPAHAIAPARAPDDDTTAPARAPDDDTTALARTPDAAANVGAARGRPAAPAAGPDRAVAALAAMTSRGDGTAYLSAWSVRELRALAARLGLGAMAGSRKADLVDRIVDRTVGFRLDSAAIRRL